MLPEAAGAGLDGLGGGGGGGALGVPVGQHRLADLVRVTLHGGAGVLQLGLGFGEAWPAGPGGWPRPVGVVRCRGPVDRDDLPQGSRARLGLLQQLEGVLFARPGGAQLFEHDADPGNGRTLAYSAARRRLLGGAGRAEVGPIPVEHGDPPLPRVHLVLGDDVGRVAFPAAGHRHVGGAAAGCSPSSR